MTGKLGLMFSGLLLFAQGYAQPWTVQTVALQNYEEALATQAQLQALDYDAYVDFGLYQGQQFVRVRVGCFDDQDSADFFARQLAGQVTAEAVAVPAESETGASLCIKRLIGFALPERWDVLASTASGISFWVELLGQRRFVAFTGTAWRVAQSERDLSSLGAAPSQGETVEVFRQDGATPRILFTWSETPLTIAVGELLWQRGAWAVVLEDGAVAAYHVEGAD